MIERRTFIAFCSGLAVSLFAAGHSLRRSKADAERKAEMNFIEELFSINADTRQVRQRDRISQVGNA